MPVLIDYRCRRCGGVNESMMPSPPPPERSCPACGGTAQRLLAAAGLVGRARPRHDEAGPRRAYGDDPPPPCLRYPYVPGLCHMTPAAARRWIAQARGDNRALERELQRQEESAVAGASGPVVDTHHHAGNGAGPRPATAPPATGEGA